ncbi:MAG: hypothetical protein AB1411_13295 [Nitrospirota bacterium]
MKKLVGMMALALALTFGMGTVTTFAGNPAPAGDKEKKDKKGGKLVFAGDKKDEKKDKKGGK